MDDLGGGKGMACEERVEACPCEPLCARSPLQPLPPCLCDLLAILVQLPDVPRDAVVGIVTSQLRRQLGVLDEHGPVAVCPTPVLDGDQGAGKAGLRRRLPHHVLSLPRLHPCVGEGGKVARKFLARRVRPPPPFGARLSDAALL